MLPKWERWLWVRSSSPFYKELTLEKRDEKRTWKTHTNQKGTGTIQEVKAKDFQDQKKAASFPSLWRGAAESGTASRRKKHSARSPRLASCKCPACVSCDRLRAGVLGVWSGGTLTCEVKTIFIICLFSLSLPHECTAEFSRGNITYHTAMDQICKQIWASSCLLLSHTLKRFVKKQNSSVLSILFVCLTLENIVSLYKTDIFANGLIIGLCSNNNKFFFFSSQF